MGQFVKSEGQRPDKGFWPSLRENGLLLLIALIMAFGLRTFVAEPRFIPSDSMVPTLAKGDRLVVEKVSYHFHPPQPGDIIVFSPPELLQAQGYDPNQAFIKRVIGTTGDIIEVKDGQVYRNQAPLQENYILENPRYRLPPLQVPPGHLFVMGDNRNNSNDSHIWGFLPQDHVIGQAIFRFYPLTRLGALNNRETLTEALGSP